MHPWLNSNWIHSQFHAASLAEQQLDTHMMMSVKQHFEKHSWLNSN